MPHHTKDKGDLACAITIADMSRKGFQVFSPVACEHLPFDLIAYKDRRCFRIQCKYSVDGYVKGTTSWSDKLGSHSHHYHHEDFDYFAIDMPYADLAVYPSISFSGCTINCSVPATFLPFYWYEDFLGLTDNAQKRTYREFTDAAGGNVSGLLGERRRKVARPSLEELQELLWSKPTTEIARSYGVTDNAVAKWAKSYGISKPPRGYWNTHRARGLSTPELSTESD